MNTNQKQALERLIAIAKRDTGQCRRVANFLLAWWNEPVCGGWAVLDVWSLDRAIMDDILVVLGMLRDTHDYPDQLGYNGDFQDILRQWRPQFFPKSVDDEDAL